MKDMERYELCLRLSQAEKDMLEADLRQCIENANDLGHFFMLMEHQGYEIKHGRRLGFRLRGEERFRYSGRKTPLTRERLEEEKARIYKAVAEINKEIQEIRREIALCDEVEKKAPEIRKTIEMVEQRKVEQTRESKAR